MTGRTTGSKLLTVWIAAFILLSAVGVFVSLSGVAVAANDTAGSDSSRIRIDSTQINEQGQIVVTLEAESTQNVSDFLFTYSSDLSSTVGPVELGGGSGEIVSAYYTQSKEPFAAGDKIRAGGQNEKVSFVFSSSGSIVPDSDRYRFNVSAYDTSYSSADAANRSVYTANFYKITSIKNHTGSQVQTVVPVQPFNATSNESYRAEFYSPRQSIQFGCRGVSVGGVCTDPDTGSNGTVVGGKQSSVEIGAPVAFNGFLLPEGNSSGKVQPSPGSVTLTADEPTAVRFGSVRTVIPSNSLSLDEVQVTNIETGNVVYRDTVSQKPGNAFNPLFLSPTTQYRVSFIDRSSFGIKNRSVVIPTPGVSGFTFQVVNGSSTPTGKLSGQVVDDSGNPVEDVTVYAEPASATSSSRVILYNSTVTDENGVYSIRVPQTNILQSNYTVRFVSNETSGGVPVHYPTVSANPANNNEGYTVDANGAILPPLTIKDGGRVDISVTTTASQLPEGAVGTLSQVSSAYATPTRTAITTSFLQFKLGQASSTSADVSLMSPASTSDAAVGYTILGFSQGGSSQLICSESPTVNEGAATTSTCSLKPAGTLNLTIKRYDDILKRSNSQFESFDGRFFTRNELVIRDASTGKIVSFIGPESSAELFTDAGSNPRNTNIPLPAGTYTAALRPANPGDSFEPPTTVNVSSTFTISQSSTTDLELERSNSFRVEPNPKRFDNPSLTRNADNTIVFNAFRPKLGLVSDEGGSTTSTSPELLSDDNVSVVARLAYPNGTVAGGPVGLSYNQSDSTFENTSFNPKSLGVDAGRYTLSVTVSNTSSDGTRQYNSTQDFPVKVSGFNTALSPSSQTVGVGDSVRVRIGAYNTRTDTLVNAPADNIKITLTNENGRVVSRTSPSSGISNGEGAFTVKVPDDTGRYRLGVTVTGNSGNQGIADTWIRVSQYDVSVSTDRDVYRPSDPVTLTVEAEDVQTDSPVSGAAVEVTVAGQRVSGATNQNGVATFPLDPAQYGTDGAWERGYPIGVTVRQQTDTGVVTKRTGTSFEVQSFEVRTRPSAEAFSKSEDVTLDVRFPSNVKVSSVSVTEIDGSSTEISGNKVSSGLYSVNLGTQPVGDHIAQVEVTTQSGATQTAITRYVVRDVNIETSLSSRTVDVGNSVSLTVGVRNPDGSVVSSKSVTANLTRPQTERVVSSSTKTTGSNGQATFSLSPSQSGFHLVEVSVGEQTRQLGLLASSVEAQFQDASGNVVTEYAVEPGSSETINIKATEGGSPAANANVSAVVFTYNNVIELGQATTDSNGVASISFTVPQSVPARDYDLLAGVNTDSGEGTVSGTLNVTGGNAFAISPSVNGSSFSPGESALFTATVTRGDGSVVANQQVEFFVTSEGAADQKVGTATTDQDGVATVSYSIPQSSSTGQYVLRTSLANQQGVRSYTGYQVRSLDVAVDAEDGPFNPGDTVNLTVFANDTVTDNAISATGGTARLVLPGSNVDKSLSLSGTAPYDVSIDIPDDSSITGTRSVAVSLSKGSASDTDSTLIEVRDETESANLTITEPVVAGQQATVTVNGTVDTNAVLTAYSPGAGAVAVNKSVSISSSADTQTGLTVDAPGTYIVKLSVPGVGTLNEVVDVESAAGQPSLTTGPSVDANATEFNTSEDIYIKSNQSSLTATVIGQNATYTVPLDESSGGTSYGVLSTARPVDVYLIRLDSADATGIADTVVEVRAE